MSMATASVPASSRSSARNSSKKVSQKNARACVYYLIMKWQLENHKVSRHETWWIYAGKNSFHNDSFEETEWVFLDLTKWLNSFYCTYFLSSTITFYHSGIASNARKRFVISSSPDCFSKTFPHYFYHVSYYDVLRHLNRSIEFWLTGFIAFSHPNNPPPEWDSGLWNFTNPWPENAQSTISSIILEV